MNVVNDAKFVVVHKPLDLLAMEHWDRLKGGTSAVTQTSLDYYYYYYYYKLLLLVLCLLLSLLLLLILLLDSASNRGLREVHGGRCCYLQLSFC